MVHNHIRIFNDVLPANTCAKLCEYARGNMISRWTGLN